jgi:hypothetical protein
MVQMDTTIDNLCGFEQEASGMYWVLDPVQNRLQYNVGETGIYTGVGLNTPAQVIDVSSSIVGGGRDNLITMCIPPVPTLPIKSENSNILSNDNNDNNSNVGNSNNSSQSKKYQGLVQADGSIVPKVVDRTGFLQPQTTTLKRSAMDYSSVDWQAGFAGNGGNLYSNPQNLTNVIERMWLERGGLDQNQLIKQSQEPFVPNTGRGPLGKGEQTCQKIRQPYNIKDPFGLPTGPNGEVLPIKPSKHFNALDVESVGISSPQLDQDNKIPFNYNAMYSNGGCNKVSFLKHFCKSAQNEI